MSDPQRSERVVESDGITVEKSFATDEFPVPAVTFRIESSRSEPVRVRLTDTIPEDFPMERVGFHPEFGSEHWTAYSDHRVEFERQLDPGATVRTVFGIRGDEIDPDAFLSPPTVEHVPEGETIEDVLGADGSNVVREVVAGDRDSLSGMDDDAEPTDAEPTDARRTEAKAQSAADGETAETRPTPRSTDGETTPAVTVADPDPEADADADENAGTDAATVPSEAGSVPVASVLASEIRSGDVPEADLELLREELDLGTPRSVDVRISRLQSRMEDLAAYADALEEFIDEEGTATEALEETRERTEAVADALADAESRLEAAADERRTVRENVETVESTLDDALAELEILEDRVADVEAVESDVERLDATVSDLESTVGAVDDDVASLESEIDRIDEELAELEAFRDRLSDAFGT
ncbi:hypothetical protein [Halopenitus persicus]|uniref:hypothetical protein n=1 Tax=Halopenitus persicus TaxID=1048396 RepID=UPI000BBB1E7C|nr:hypothetical protein [Halopenitus persicus]